MPNREQTQNRNRKDQSQKGGQNPGTFSPDDDETPEADQTQLGAQNEPGRKKRRNPEQMDEQPAIEDPAADEEGEEDEDEDDGVGSRQ